MPYKVDTPDLEIAQIAAKQHGVATTGQLETAGLGRMAISESAKRGRLHRLHRGVYAVGHRAPSWHGRWMAAVLACGEEAVLSHHSAAALWELLKPNRRCHPGLDPHYQWPQEPPRHPPPPLSLPLPAPKPSPSPSSSPSEGGRGRRLLTTHRRNISVTTIPRTIEDLEGTVAPHLLRRAKRQAELKGIHLEGTDHRRARSDLEEDFFALVQRHHLPLPETNVKLGRHEVDFLWRREHLVVETDSYLYHRGAVSFEDDRARDLDLRQLGYTVLRFTDVQIENEPERVAALVAHDLGVASLPAL